MDKNNMGEPKQPVQETGAGRLVKNDLDPQSYRDISLIDRQEGDMNNGELGGNFSRENEIPPRS
jgi:hypothetical protein